MERLITITDRLYDGTLVTIRNCPLWMVELGSRAYNQMESEAVYPKWNIAKRFHEARYERPGL